VTWVGVVALVLTAAVLLIMAAASYRRSNGAVLGHTEEAVTRSRPPEDAQ
jgi:heme/copper-type cytochrome/quinol oxidase subunit 2